MSNKENKDNDIKNIEHEEIKQQNSIEGDEEKSKGKNLWIIMGILSLGVILWSGVVYAIVSSEKIDNIKTTTTEYEQPQDKNTSDIDKEYLQLIEDMADQLVQASTKWGDRAVTPENIESTIKLVQGMENNNDRAYLEKELLKWRDGNFDNSVEVHNYAWMRLGGTVGKATGLDKVKIEKLQKKYFNN